MAAPSLQDVRDQTGRRLDYRDLVIEDLADEAAGLREEVRAEREVKRLAITMLARVRHERDRALSALYARKG